MSAKGSRFARLVRHFTYRFVDHDLIAVEGQGYQTLVHVLALLMALSVVITVALLFKYLFILDLLPPTRRQQAVWSDQAFLIKLTMTAIGFFTVLGWEALFPDRRDSHTLGVLPVPLRTLFSAKLLAILLFLGLILLAATSWTSIFFPFLVAGQSASLARVGEVFVATVITLAAAGGFAFFSLFALQAVLINLLPYRLYRWLTAWLQLLAVLVLLIAFFAMPNLATVRQGPAWLGHVLPPYWFLSAYQHLLGAPQPLPGDLTGHAAGGLALAVTVALGGFALGYRRTIRKAVEHAELGPRRQGTVARIAAPLLERLWLRVGRERAAFWFVARTMARSRKHRLWLAVCCAAGLTWVAGGFAYMLRRALAGQVCTPSPALASIPFDLAFLLLMGVRLLFSIPVQLKANWIFRLTEGAWPGEYLAGVRKFVILLGIVPLVLLPAPLYATVWGAGAALRHSALVLLVALLALETVLWSFPKIPFTCSMLPGKADLKVRFAIYFVLLTSLSVLLGLIDCLMMLDTGAFLCLASMGVVGYGFVVRARNRHESEGWRFLFEEKPDWVAALNLAG